MNDNQQPNVRDVLIKATVVVLTSRLSTATLEERATGNQILHDSIRVIGNYALLALLQFVNSTHDRIVIASHPDLRQLERDLTHKELQP